MKVLHINCNFSTTALHQKMIEKLEKDEICNSVYVPVCIGAKNSTELNESVIISPCFAKKDRFVFDYKQKKIWNDIKKFYDFAEFDLIHAYTLFTDGNCARRISEQFGIPYVVAIRNTDVNAFLKWMVHLRHRGVRIMRDASAVFFLSDAYRKQVFEKYIPAKYRVEIQSKSFVIPNGIDDFWLANLPDENLLEKRKTKLENKELDLIYAGRIDKNKNIPTIQKAAEILKKKGWKVNLTVVGKIADQSEYEKITQGENTIVKPAQQKEKLIKEYRNNSIFVMPSFQETFGLVYAEAMSQGLPVVYSKGQGFDGQFPEGTVGFSADSKSAETVAEAIEKCCISYEMISRNCVSHVDRFNWDTLADKYIELYQSITK